MTSASKKPVRVPRAASAALLALVLAVAAGAQVRVLPSAGLAPLGVPMMR